MDSPTHTANNSPVAIMLVTDSRVRAMAKAKADSNTMDIKRSRSGLIRAMVGSSAMKNMATGIRPNLVVRQHMMDNLLAMHRHTPAPKSPAMGAPTSLEVISKPSLATEATKEDTINTLMDNLSHTNRVMDA